MLSSAESAAKKEEERLSRMLHNKAAAARSTPLKPMAILGAPRPPAVVPPRKGSVLTPPATSNAAPTKGSRAPPDRLNAEEIALCKQKFKEADKDQSGRVEQGELIQVLEEAFGTRVRELFLMEGEKTRKKNYVTLIYSTDGQRTY